jgi:RNA polymerase sigma-70 factor (ECF subfamily)
MAITTEAEFTEIYRAHYPDLLRFVARRAHPLNVEDIVGETFLAAWRRRNELPAELRPWLFRTARNAMLNSQRGAHRQAALAVRIGEAENTKVSIGMPSLEQRMDLIAAWRTLPAADQEVLALDVWEDLSAKDAAATLGYSRAAYAMRLTRARRALAALLTTPVTGPISLVTTS